MSARRGRINILKRNSQLKNPEPFSSQSNDQQSSLSIQATINDDRTPDVVISERNVLLAHTVEQSSEDNLSHVYQKHEVMDSEEDGAEAISPQQKQQEQKQQEQQQGPRLREKQERRLSPIRESPSNPTTTTTTTTPSADVKADVKAKLALTSTPPTLGAIDKTDCVVSDDGVGVVAAASTETQSSPITLRALVLTMAALATLALAFVALPASWLSKGGGPFVENGGSGVVQLGDLQQQRWLKNNDFGNDEISFAGLGIGAGPSIAALKAGEWLEMKSRSSLFLSDDGSLRVLRGLPWEDDAETVWRSPLPQEINLEAANSGHAKVGSLPKDRSHRFYVARYHDTQGRDVIAVLHKRRLFRKPQEVWTLVLQDPANPDACSVPPALTPWLGLPLHSGGNAAALQVVSKSKTERPDPPQREGNLVLSLKDRTARKRALGIVNLSA